MANTADEREIAWYFDFVSPFAYLQHETLKIVQRNREGFRYTPVPVLFAGLLKHHEHKGPAEIDSKRKLTYRYCQWYAQRHGIPFRFPAVHPFNPLPFLRLAIARDNDPAIIDRLFRHVWVESGDNPEFAGATAIESLPGCANAMLETADAEVKNRLKTNTEDAIRRGVFGVPTLRIGEELFWGVDMTEMALACLDDPGMFESEAYRAIDQLPAPQRGSG